VVAGGQNWTPGDKMPEFSAKGDDGKTYTLASLTKKGPAVFYFIKSPCPTNEQALKYYIRIANAYKGAKVPFIGVINADLDGFKSWNAPFKVPFRVLLDPEEKIISAWKIRSSPSIVMVDKSGKVVQGWPAYSKAYLQQLNELIAKASGVQTKTCDFSGAPTNPRYG
jgi:peroxiredoxin